MEAEPWSGRLSDLLTSDQDVSDFQPPRSDAAYFEDLSNYDTEPWWPDPSSAGLDGLSDTAEADMSVWSECTTLLHSGCSSPPDLVGGFESIDAFSPGIHPTPVCDPSAFDLADNLEGKVAERSPVTEDQASEPDCLAALHPTAQTTPHSFGAPDGLPVESNVKQNDAQMASTTKRKVLAISVCPATGCGKSFRTGFKKHLALHKPGRSVRSATRPDKTAADLYDEMCRDARRLSRRKVKVLRKAQAPLGSAEPGHPRHMLVWPTANDTG